LAPCSTFLTNPESTIDYKFEDRENVGQLRNDIGGVRLGLDSRFRKTAIITLKKRTVQPGDVFEDTGFKLGFEIAKF
jgi:hypothetical protein